MKEHMEIYIQGLRSLRDTQTVCIGKKITFLVGPNSAGKSTVLLALQKLEQEGLEFQPDMDNLYKNPRCDEIAQLQMLGMGYKDAAGTHHATTATHFFFSTGGTKPFLFGKIEKTDARKDADTRAESEYLDFFHSATIASKNKPIGFAGDDDNIEYCSTKKIFESGYLKSLVDNGYAKNIGQRTQPGTARSKNKEWEYPILYQKYENDFIEKSGIIQIRKTENNTHLFNKIEGAIEDLQSIDGIHKAIHKSDDGSFFVNKYSLFESLSSFVAENKLKGSSIQSLKNKAEFLYSAFKRVAIRESNAFLKSVKPIKIFTVSASRAVPQGADLRLFFGKEKGQYQDIFESAVLSAWDPSIPRNKEANKSLIQKINASLSGDLFIDNGYQISVSADLLLGRNRIAYGDKDEYGDEIEFFEDVDTLPDDGDVISAEISKTIFDDSIFFCEISLKDAHGKNLEFNDIGSGIGYVFPILYEIHRAARKDHFIFIQQPELHLHPAMQANLTDTLIRATSDRSIIAETHSEHMILRALKRIRQTKNETLTDPELALTPEDVAINYFEPQGDGSTRVHNIRISADGDFLDKWPKGFFAERDQELFDE